MAKMTVDIPDALAERIEPLVPWLPTVLEISLIGYRTPAAATATEVVDFLATKPSLDDIAVFHVSEQAQARVRRLLALNEAGLLGEIEQRELDELQRIEHAVILLKAQVAAQRSQEP